MSLSGNQDVGGLAGPLTVTFSMRGGPGNEGRLTVDGLSLGASLNGTGVSYTVADVGNAQEVVFSTAGSLGEAENAGPAMNLVPRQGGNRFSGTFFANGANDAHAGQQLHRRDPCRRACARRTRSSSIWDVERGDRRSDHARPLWFFSAARYQGNHRLVGGMFRNRNAGDPNEWTYVAGRGRPGRRRQQLEERQRADHAGRPRQRNKFNFYWDEQRNCTLCNDGGSATHGARGARQQPVAAARAAGHLDVARDQPPPVRGRIRQRT